MYVRREGNVNEIEGKVKARGGGGGVRLDLSVLLVRAGGDGRHARAAAARSSALRRDVRREQRLRINQQTQRPKQTQEKAHDAGIASLSDCTYLSSCNIIVII
jgi:hypothetical protein